MANIYGREKVIAETILTGMPIPLLMDALGKANNLQERPNRPAERGSNHLIRQRVQLSVITKNIF
jgi:hypothetical protein